MSQKIIKEFHQAREVLDGIVGRLVREIETEVGNEFAANGPMKETDLRITICRAVSRWVARQL